VGCFLEMEEKQRRMYVARMLGLDQGSPASWPKEMIDDIISRAEHRADESVRDDCRRSMSRT
jgi:hypothetical protein